MNRFVRISESFNTIKDFIEGIECKTIVVYEHPPDEEVNRVHIHMLILEGTKVDDTLKTRYCKLYKPTVKGNPLWCWKEAVDSECITYMSKGNLQPIYYKGITIEEIETYRVKWVDPKTKFLTLENGKLVKPIDESTKKTKRQMLEQVRLRLSDTSTTRDILRAIRKVLMDNNEVIGQYKMMDFYDSYMMYNRKEDWLCAMEKRILSKYDI